MFFYFILVCLIPFSAESLRLLGTENLQKIRPLILRKNTFLQLTAIEYVPILILSSAAIFGIFSIENNIDLTDAGIASAKAKRRALKKEREQGSVPKEALDPYRWFADDDDDVDLFPPKKSGGGCG